MATPTMSSLSLDTCFSLFTPTFTPTNLPFSFLHQSINTTTNLKSHNSNLNHLPCYLIPLLKKHTICKAAEYQFPDPIPEFAETETEKFKAHLLKKLSKKDDLFGDKVDEVVGICTEIFSTFMHAEYGGPGTLLVIPFIDMADTLNERELPGGPQAARVAVKWAQANVDNDWKEWTNSDD